MGFLSRLMAHQPINVAALHLALKSAGEIDRDVLAERYPDISIGDRDAAAVAARHLYDRAGEIAATMRPGAALLVVERIYAGRDALAAEFASWPEKARNAALAQRWHETFDNSGAAGSDEPQV